MMLYQAQTCVLFDVVNSKYNKTSNSLETDYPTLKQTSVVSNFCCGKWERGVTTILA
jgi:hypothetical protein